jgi:hypothetical protein
MSILSGCAASTKPPASECPDVRESLVNGGAVGPAGANAVPVERVARLRGLVVDLDPKLLVPDNPIFPPSDDPRVFHDNVRAVLDRHPVLRHAEVGSSGTGLHAVAWLEPHVELSSARDQGRWAAVVRAVQSSVRGTPMPRVSRP